VTTHHETDPGSSQCVHAFIPPHIMEAISKNGTPAQRAKALRTLAVDHQIRTTRTAASLTAGAAPQKMGPPRKNRLIYTCNNNTALPGTLVRSEGQAASGDVAVNEAYDGFGATFDLYNDIYGRNSIDDNGMDLIGSVHYDSNYDNAFFDGTQMVFGDGDGTIFNRFTIAIDIMGHELTHGVTQSTAGLVYQDQSGALNESMSDVFGSLVKQRSLGQAAAQADWLIGAGLLAAGVNGVALRSMKAPGTAYDDPLFGGKDPQPDHMRNYDHTRGDNGGVHINSGIPNKAFYLVAIALGGNAWEAPGKIWYKTLTDPRLTSTAQFNDFAWLSADNANALYGAAARDAVVRAWLEVGIDLHWSLVSQSAGFGNLLDGQHPVWIADFSGVGHAQIMFYYAGDGNWWLADMINGQLQWSLVSQSAGFGNLLDGQHPVWIGDFTGVGHAQIMFYYAGDGNWWLADMVNGQLQWSLVSQTAGFGNLIDGQHPIWIADFTGVGHAQIMFYYAGDGNWWLADMIGGQLQWSLVSQSAGFGNLLDGQHPVWIADFKGAGHAQIMFYYAGDGNWWLADMINGQLQWSLVSQTAGFGNLLDGQHPIWIADFTSSGHAQIMFYYAGDGNWWLADLVGGQLQWSLVSQSAGFGNLLDGQHPIWIADFTGARHAQIMFYYAGDGNWWLADMIGGQLQWNLVSQTAGFGNLLDGQHPFWLGDFTGVGHTQIIFYYAGDGNWWLADMVAGGQQWSLFSQTTGFGNLIDGQHPVWIADFTGARHDQIMFYYAGDGNWWLRNL
jgi:Thermolysin metallopeptidase, alpha-helical domain/Thermolysin metallopeptidase, catalytic domain